MNEPTKPGNGIIKTTEHTKDSLLKMMEFRKACSTVLKEGDMLEIETWGKNGVDKLTGKAISVEHGVIEIELEQKQPNGKKIHLEISTNSNIGAYSAKTGRDLRSTFAYKIFLEDSNGNMQVDTSTHPIDPTKSPMIQGFRQSYELKSFKINGREF